MVQSGTISGKVVDPQGRPLPFIRVQAFRPGAQALNSGVVPDVASRMTDDRGEYRMFFVPPGEYLIRAQVQGGRPAGPVPNKPGEAEVLVTTLFPGTTDMAQAWESFFIEHLSWQWIFWNATVLTPIMIVLVHFGIPWQPLPKPQPGHPTPNWRGFLYASLGAALLYIALDQGQRLDWFHSPLFIGLVASGALLIVAAIVRHFMLPNPLINYQFLMRRNTLLLAPVLISFRFIMLATVVSIPSFLGSVRGFLPLQEAPVLAWVALPPRRLDCDPAGTTDPC